MSVTEADIQAMTDTIVRKFSPEMIVLFGSRARGSARNDSDVDLLVVMPHGDSAARLAGAVRVALPHTISIDVVVRDRIEVERLYRAGDSFFRDVLDSGRRLYERAA